MEQMKQILEGSLLWRLCMALSAWFGTQWRRSAVVHWFLHPAQWLKASSEHSVFFWLWSKLRGGLCWLYDKLKLEKLFGGSVFFAPWFWCAAAAGLAALLPTMLTLGMVLVAFCSLALVLVARRERELTFSPMNKYILFFMLTYLLATIMSVTPGESLKPGMLFLLFTGFALVTENGLADRRQLERFTAILVLGASVVAFIGLCQYIFGVSGADSWVDEDMFSSIKTRVYSTLQNPNVLAEYLVLILPLAGALLLTAKTWGKRLLWFFCCGLITVALLLTFSRGGWLGALIAGAIFVVMMKPALIMLAPVALVILWFMLPETITSRFSSIGNMKDSSTSYRVSIWMGTIAMLKDYWVCGIGPGTAAFNQVYPAYSYNAANAQHSHNLFLQLVCDGGILALILFLLIIFAFGRQVCTAVSKNKNWRERIFPIAALCGVLGFLAQGMTDFTFYNHRMTLVFWAVLGLGAAWAKWVAEGGDHA